METVEIPLRCPDCGLVLVYMVQDHPTVYRHCPKCGERKLYWDVEARKLKDQVGAQ